jgi:hypothetical protein
LSHDGTGWRAHGSTRVQNSDLVGAVDPVDGTQLRVGEGVWVCHCHAAYHTESYEYLFQHNGGRCVSCQQRSRMIHVVLSETGSVTFDLSGTERESGTQRQFAPYRLRWTLALVAVATLTIAIISSSQTDWFSANTSGTTNLRDNSNNTTSAVRSTPTTRLGQKGIVATRAPQVIVVPTVRIQQSPTPVATPRSTRTPRPTSLPTRTPTTIPRLAHTPTSTLTPQLAVAPTATPTQRPQPTATATGRMLYEREVLYQRPLTEWNTHADERGWFAIIGDALEIGVRGGQGAVHGSWTNQADFSNVSVAVDMRLTTEGRDVQGCVDSRHDPSTGSYAFCLGSDGSTSAIYSYRDINGIWRQDYLLEPAHRPGTNPVTQWNNLKIVSHDDHFWFVINGVVHGPVFDTRRSNGSAAIFVVNWDSQPAAFAFRSLIVKAVD